MTVGNGTVPPFVLQRQRPEQESRTRTAGVHTFSYDGNNHLTGETFANLQHQWAYSSNGMLGDLHAGRL